MSMFHELMMRKKEEIMYATIKGTLTESPEGVFSGFTTNDYVENTSFPTNVDFSGKIRAKINAEASGWNGVFYIRKITSPNNMFSVEINNTNLVRIYRFDESSNSNLSDGIYNLVLADVWVDYVFDYNKTTKILNVSAIKVLDNSTIFTKTYSGVVLDGGTLKLGFVFNALNGSIDLNNSYIKLGSTKYKLQAVVGYTKVGNPTISPDGVVSGFTNSDYITTPILNFSTLDNFEINIKFICVSTTSYTLISYNRFLSIWQGGGNSRIYIDLNDNPSSYRTSFIYTIDNETTITIQRKNSNLYVYGNGELLATYENFTPFDSNREIYWCKSAFDGSLIIKDCYIKVNNKLWFNGQPS